MQSEQINQVSVRNDCTALLLRTCVVLLSLLSIAPVARAITIEGWTCEGSCGTLGANGSVTASPAGPQYGYITTSGSASVAPPSITALTGSGATSGSRITSPPFTAAAGQTLSFFYNYITSDGAGFSDFAWASLIDQNGAEVAVLFTARTTTAGNTVPGFNMPAALATLTPVNAPVIPGAPNWSPLADSNNRCFGPGCGFTGWVSATYTVPSQGTYRLQFGVTNWSDTVLQSGLAFDGALIAGLPIGEAKSLSQNLECAGNLISAMNQSQFSGPGYRGLLLALLRNVTTYGPTPATRPLALLNLNAMIVRTDGCALRGSPDTMAQGGNNADFVAACPDQGPLYACLTAARTQLNSLP